MKEVYKLIKIICDDLKIGKVKVVVNNKLLTATTLAEYVPSNNTLNIRKDYKSEYDLYFSIAHELRHKYQIDNELFNYDTYQTREVLDVKEYNLQFEEVDANAYASIILITGFGVKPLFQGLEEEVKKAIQKRMDEILEEYRYFAMLKSL